MRVIVMNQREAENYSANKQVEPSFMISITSLNQENAKVYATRDNNIFKVLKLSFDDTDNGYGMTLNDANKIKDFIIEAIEHVELIIVHCGAGQSRSAGVAAAILKYLYNDDSQIFNNPRYTPNMRCYSMVLSNLMGY